MISGERLPSQNQQHRANEVNMDRITGARMPNGLRPPLPSTSTARTPRQGLSSVIDPTSMSTVRETLDPPRQSTSAAVVTGSFDIDEATTMSGGTSWTLRMPWLQNVGQDSLLERNEDSLVVHDALNPSSSLSPMNNRYHGGLMKVNTPDIKEQEQRSRKGRRTSSRNFSSGSIGSESSMRGAFQIFRAESWLTSASVDDTVADFKDSEWTPQDSSYGAAIPVCGWIPKKIRQGIEYSLIILILIGLVYLVVTTSITLSEQNGKSSKHLSKTTYNDTVVQLDDDRYIDDKIDHDDDHYTDDKYH